jgi:hypothetical protein
MRLDILQIVYSSFDTLQVVNCCVSFTYTWNDSVLPNPSVIFKLIQHLSFGSMTSMLAGGLGPVNGWLYCEKISNYEHYKFHRKQEKWPTGLVLDLEEHESDWVKVDPFFNFICAQFYMVSKFYKNVYSIWLYIYVKKLQDPYISKINKNTFQL